MTLRIATWSCYRGEAQLRTEFQWQLGADIAILQECGQPASGEAGRGWGRSSAGAEWCAHRDHMPLVVASNLDPSPMRTSGVVTP